MNKREEEGSLEANNWKGKRKEELSQDPMCCPLCVRVPGARKLPFWRVGGIFMNYLRTGVVMI